MLAPEALVSDSPGIRLMPSAHARDLTYKNTREAFEQGLGAYRAGFYEIAIPAFEYVIAKNDPQQRFFAEFYLGRMLADNTGTQTDHAKAYIFFQKLADENADIDPDDLKKAPFVAKALTAVALYVRDGLPEIALKADEQRAVEYLRHAATFFNEPDAQFELAKMFIASETDRPTAMHYLQKLSKQNHAGAQAVLADLFARGKYVKQDTTQALGLIKLAVENATPSERLWIEDIYQHIYCGSTKDTRDKSKALVADWRKIFMPVRPTTVEQPSSLGRRGDTLLTRVCSNGERLDIEQQRAGEPPAAASTLLPAQPASPSGMTTASQPSFSLVPGAPAPTTRTPLR